MPNYSLEIIAIGSTYIIRPPVALSGSEVWLKAADKLTKDLGHEYDYPTVSKQTVLSIVRELLSTLENSPTSIENP